MPTKEVRQKHFYMKFEKNDWLTEQSLTLCSLATRGFWMDLLCVLHNARSGQMSATAAEFGRLCRCSAEEAAACLRELNTRGVADVLENPSGYFHVTCRRLMREFGISDARKQAAEKRWTPEEEVGDKKGLFEDGKGMQNPDYDSGYDCTSKEEVQEEKRVEVPARDLDQLVPAIVCAHPIAVTRLLKPQQVTHAQAASVLEVLATDHIPPHELLAKVQSIADVVLAEWPPGERKFLANIERFFRERQFNKPLEEWRNAKSTANRNAGKLDAAREALRRADAAAGYTPGDPSAGAG